MCVREFLKGKGRGGRGGQPPRYALHAEFEFQTTQEDGGDDVKEDRHVHTLNPNTNCRSVSSLSSTHKSVTSV